MTLDPEKWAEAGTLGPETSPRPLEEIRDNFTGIFAPQSRCDRLIYNLPFNIMHWQKGLVHSRVVPVLHRRFIFKKPARWVRDVFINDPPTPASNSSG